MKRVLQRPYGFTLIELIVVIAIIGILASLTVFGFSRFQEDTRDAQREASATVIIESLEEYFDENGEYPSCPAVTAPAATVTSTTLPGLDQTVLIAPNAPTSTTNSLKCEDITINGEDIFEYEGDGSPECLSGGSCLQYTLKYKEEGSDSIVEIASRRSTPISATGTISNLNVTATGFSTIDATWATIPGASGYRLQRATNSTFTTGLVSTDVTNPEASVTGLAVGTTYYFRVTQIVLGTPGNWSNTDSALTWAIGTPTLQTANVASATSVTLTWTNVSYESTYTVQYSTSSTFASGNQTITGIAANTTSRTVTGLTTGTTYYFRVQGVAMGDTGDYSNSLSATPIGQGSITSTSGTTCGQATINWSALAGAASYEVRHSTSSSMTSPTIISGATGTSRVITGLSQGVNNYFTVAGITSSGYVGAASAVATQLVTTCPPPAYSVSQSNGSSLTATANVTCAAGTTAYYSWTANGGAWVAGTQYRSVSYALGYGQGVTLAVTSRCQGTSSTSGFVAGNNSVSYTRPGMNLSISFGDDACAGSFCGRDVNASWSNVCGAAITSMRIYATQYSYNTNFQPETTTFHDTRWKGDSSPGAPTSYNVNISCTSQTANFNVISAYRCTGC